MILIAAAIAAVAALWPPNAGETMVIYSAMGPGEPLVSAFEAESGVRVTYINMAGGPLQARIYAEGPRPRWTLAWLVGDASMAALDSAGLLQRDAMPDAIGWTPQARALLPANGAYAPTGLTIAGVFLTHGGVAPRTWRDLGVGPAGIGLVSPVMSGTAYPVLSALFAATGGSEDGHTLLQGIGPDRLGIAATNPLLIAQLRRGDIDLAILPSQAAYTLARREPEFQVTVPHPAGLVPAVIGISAGTSPAMQSMARRFVDFVLTPRGQALILRSTAEGMAWPPIEGVPTPAGLPALADLSLVHPDPVFWGARQGEEIGWFRRVIAP